MKFGFYRLLLINPEQKDLFEPATSRETAVEMMFGANSPFQFRESSCAYKFEGKTGDFIVGRIGKLFERTENLPPEQGFEEYIHSGWTAAYVVVDILYSKDQQTIALQLDARVGSIENVFIFFLNLVAKQNAVPYEIKLEKIVEKGSFWDFAKENENSIRNITFRFIAPNGMWTSGSIRDEMREFQKDLRTNEVSIGFSSKAGLNIESDKIRDGVNYIETGNGSMAAVAKNNKRYSSKRRQRKVEVETPSEKLSDNQKAIFISTIVKEILDR